MKNSLFSAFVCCLLVTAQVASAQINLSFSFVSPSCHGYTNGSATVTPSGGTAPYSFQWNNGQTTQTNSGIGAGTYFVTVTDAGNHVASGNVTVTEPDPFLASITPSGITCDGNGGVLTAHGTGGPQPFGFNWSTQQTTQSVQVTGPNNYYVTVIDANGCAGTAAYTVPSQIAVDVMVTDIPCATDPLGGAVNAVATGGTTPYSYHWNDGSTNPSRQGLPAGTYTVTVTGNNGCTATDFGVINIPSPLVVSIVSITPACNGASTGGATIQVTGGVPPYTHIWTPGNYTGTTVTGLAPGQYYVCTFDANHCQKDLWVVIPEITSLDVSLSVVSAECTGVPDGVVTALVNPPGNYEYTWNLPPYHGVTQLTGLAGNTFVSVTVTDPISGCSGTASTTVGFHNSIHINVVDTDIHCAGQDLGTATAMATDGTPDYTYVWLTPPTGPQIGVGPTITGLQAGSYMVSVTDSRGCTAIGAADIGIESAPNAVIQGLTAVECGDSLTQVQFTNLSTDAYGTIVSAVWYITTPSGIDTFVNVSPVTLTLPVGVSGSAQLIVTSANGCQDTALTNFIVPGIPNISLSTGPEITDCNNGPVHIVVNGGKSYYSYVWTPLTGLTLDSIPPNAVANPTETTTYQLVANDHGCTDTVSVKVIRVIPIDLTIDQDTIVTCDSTAVLFAHATSTTATIIWVDAQGNPVLPLGNPVTVPAGATTIYTAIATDINGCIDSLPVWVTGVPSISLSTGEVMIDCNNGPVHIIVNGGSPGYTYVWSPTTGLTFDSIPPSVTANPTVTTTYQLIASAQGCSDTLSVEVVRVPSIGLTIDQDTIVTCDSTTVLFAHADSASTHIIWVDAQGNPVLPLGNPVTVATGTTTIYTAIATDSYGCIDSLPVSVTGLPGVHITADSVALDCDNGPVSIQVQGGNPGLTYVWSPTTGLTPDGVAPNVIANPAVTTTYQLIASNQACSDTLSVHVIRVQPIGLTVDQDTIVTCDSTAVLFAHADSASTHITWVDAQGNPVLPLGNPVTVAAGTTTTYTAIATDIYGCVDSLPVSVTGLPGVHVSADSVAVDCANGPVHIVVTGGSPDLTYVWTPTTDLTPDGVAPNVIANPAVTTIYQLIASNQACSDTLSVNVIRVQPIGLTVDQDTIMTCDSTAVLFAHAASTTTTIHWIDAQGNPVLPLGNPVTVPAGATTIYTAIATDTYGCVDSLPVSVSGVPGVHVSADSIAVDCANGPVHIVVTGGNPGYTYIWSPMTDLTPDGTAPNVIANPAVTTTYQLIASAMGCSDTLSVNVIRVQPIGLTVDQDTIMTCDSTAVLFAHAASSTTIIHWIDAQGNPVLPLGNPVTVPAGATTIYTAIATDTYGCVDSLPVSVTGLPGVHVSADSVAVDCANGPVHIVVTGGNPGYTYVWSPMTDLTPDGTAPNVIANPAVTTTYQLIASAMGCSDTLSVNVIRVQPIGLTVDQDTIMTCDSTAVLFAHAASTSTTIHWIDAQGNPVLPVGNPVTVPAGATTIYTAIATDTYGCVDSLPVSVTGLPGVHVSADSVAVDCANGPVSIIVTGGSPDLTYVWSPTTDLTPNGAAPNVIVNPAVTTTYQLIASNQACSDTLTVNVIRVQPIGLTVDQDTIVTCDSTAVLFAHAASTSTSIHWIDAQGNPVLPLGNPVTVPAGATTIYTAIATDTYGCVDSLPVSVTGLPSVNVSADSVAVDCDNGPVSIVVTGGSPDLTYVWSPTTDLTPNGAAPNVIANPAVTTTYQLIASNQACSDTLSVKVVRVTPINLTVDQDTIVTCNATAVLQAHANIPNVIWVTAQGDPVGNPPGNPVTVSTGATTTYIAIATDAYGCADSLPVSVTGIPGLDLSAPPELVDCDNLPVHIVVSGGMPGYTYEWSPTTGLTPDPVAPSVTANPSVTTIYQLITTVPGCSDTLTVKVIRVRPIELTVASDPIETCDSTAVLLAVSNVTDVKWVDPAGVVQGTPPTFNPVTVPAGATVVYTAIATDTNGCVDSLAVPVTSVGTDVDVDPEMPGVGCVGSSIQLGLINHHPNDVLVYQWTVTAPLVITGSTTASPTVAGPAGTYNVTVTVTNQAQCTQTLIIPLQIDEMQSIEQQISVDLCNGKEVKFHNTSGLSGVWNFGDNQTSEVDSPTHTYDHAGLYLVTFTPGESVCIMPWDSMINVQDMALAPPTIANNYVICIEKAEINFTGTSNNPNVTWSWTFTGGTPTTSNQQNPVVTFTQEDTITAVLVIVDQNGCKDTSTMANVEVLFINDSIPETLTFCIDTTVQLNPDGVDPNATYEWASDPLDLNFDKTAKNPTVSPDVETVYTVTISQGTSCSVTYQVTVTPLEGPNLSLPDDMVVCNDDPVVLTVTGTGTNYIWSESPTFNPVLGTGPSITVTPVKNGVYYVTTATAFGCKALDSIKVNNAALDIQPEPWDGDICAGEETSLQVTNLDPEHVVTYQWIPNLPNVPNPVVTPTENTTYTVYLSNQYGCKDTLNFLVNVSNVTVDATITGKDTICPGQSTTLLATPSGNGVTYTYLWSPGSSLSADDIPNPIATPESEQVYVVTVTNDQGCTATDEVLVHFISGQCVEPYIFVPKAFTPNNDSNNDFFIVRGVNITELVFIVWDRWGEKVYETTDPAAVGWDGTYKGQELTPDSYAWYLRARCGNGAVYEKKGDVTLLK